MNSTAKMLYGLALHKAAKGDKAGTQNALDMAARCGRVPMDKIVALDRVLARNVGKKRRPNPPRRRKKRRKAPRRRLGAPRIISRRRPAATSRKLARRVFKIRRPIACRMRRR